MTDLVFRNVDASSPDQPVSEWPLEGIQAALERGSLTYWRRMAKAIQAEPWGPVAAEISHLVDESGLTRADFASRIGTSTSRLSTYVNGKVTPSASLLVRMRRVTGEAFTSLGGA